MCQFDRGYDYQYVMIMLIIDHADHADDDAGNPLRSRFHDLFRPSLYKVTLTAFHVFKDPYFHFLPLIMWHGIVHVHFFLMSISNIYFPLSYPESITYPPPHPCPYFYIDQWHKNKIKTLTCLQGSWAGEVLW